MANYFYTHAGRQYGPVSAMQLRQLAAQGGIMSGDSVAQEGNNRWVKAGTVKGLFPVPDEDPLKFLNEQQARSAASTDPQPTAADDPLAFLKETKQTQSVFDETLDEMRASVKGVAKEAFGELRTSVKGVTRKATKTAIKIGIGFACLFGMCSSLVIVAHLMPKDDISQHATIVGDCATVTVIVVPGPIPMFSAETHLMTQASRIAKAVYNVAVTFPKIKKIDVVVKLDARFVQDKYGRPLSESQLTLGTYTEDDLDEVRKYRDTDAYAFGSANEGYGMWLRVAGPSLF